MPPPTTTHCRRFFSAVEGALVVRYGTGELIGAAYLPGGGVAFDLDRIVGISEAEAAAYLREYDRAVRAGSLRERTEEEFLAYLGGLRGLEAAHDAAIDQAETTTEPKPAPSRRPR